MKNRVLAILAVSAIGALAIYANKSASLVTVEVPAKTAGHSIPRVPPPVMTKQIEMPSLASPTPAATKMAAPEPNPVAQTLVADSLATPSPRAELSTMIPELARLIDAQDYETLMQDFMPPDELTAMLADCGQPGQPMALADMANRIRQDPGMVQKMAAASKFMAYLQTQTPDLDETGENASYPMPMVVNGKNTINFVKVEGNWYVKDGREYFR